MLERLELGNFERVLFITLLALMVAVFNLGVRLRAAPAGISDSGSYVVSYHSPITSNVFTAQEIQPLALVTEPAPQPETSQLSNTTPQAIPTQQTTSKTNQKSAQPRQSQFQTQSQSQQDLLTSSILNKLL